MRGASFEDVLPRVAEIVADVRERGDAALLDWTERLDGERPELRVPADQLLAAQLQADELEALHGLADAVAAFCGPQRPPDVALEAVEGVHSERRWVPLASVGVYVPGGRASYPSSLVMAAVPARVAGVERIAIVTPKASEATLAAAHALGIDEVYSVGGAQAVAALAFGTETVASVDKIVGPGNRWVTAAKLLISSHVAIDLPAGPSEVVLIADASADPARCAADLLAQSEHGPDSEASSSASIPRFRAVRALVAGTENVSIRDVATLDEALALSETYAPEHISSSGWKSRAIARTDRNAGTVFVRTSAVVGDYAARDAHPADRRPGAGCGGLGLETFLKPIQLVRAADLSRARAIGLPLARLEGLQLHAAALELG